MRCPCCQGPLGTDQGAICPSCREKILFLSPEEEKNALWLFFCGRIRFEHAIALSLYEKDDTFSRLLKLAKYSHLPYINSYLTNLLLDRLDGTGWPFDIDVIVPIPIHWVRLLRRGYNQVGPIAQTLSHRWQVPVEWGGLRRQRYIKSQVGLSWNERAEQQRRSLSLRHPERLAGKHILLVDDICTTGATLLAAADIVLTIPGTRVSILALAKTI